MKKILNPTSLSLKFTPTAWSKLLYLRDLSNHEVGGFGISSEDNLLRIIDIALVKQVVTSTSVDFDDITVADFFDAMVSKGKNPNQFARIWIHTHPGCSATPSSTDETTFKKAFGSCDWSIMAIIAKDNGTYARLRINQGITGEIVIPVIIDYEYDFKGCDFNAWKEEYKQAVHCNNHLYKPSCTLNSISNRKDDKTVITGSNDLVDQFIQLPPLERQYVLDELVYHNEFLAEYESEVYYE